MITYRNSSGLTLIEVLIAISLLTITLVLVFNSLYTISRSWHIGQTKIGYNHNIRTTYEFIQKQFNQAVPLQWNNAGEIQLLFFGDEHHLTFVSNLPSPRGGGGLSLVSLELSKSTDKNLVLNYQYADPSQITTILEQGKKNKTILLEQVEDISFQYYGKKSQKDELNWHNEWHDAKLMPKLISIKISQTIPAIIWPELIFRTYNQAQKGLAEFILFSKEKIDS